MESASHVKPRVEEGPHGLQCCLSPAGPDEAFLVVQAPPRQSAVLSAGGSYDWIAAQLVAGDLEIVHERVFASRACSREILRERHRALTDAGVPPDGAPSYIEGRPAWGEGVGGVLVHAVRPRGEAGVWTIRNREADWGRGWKQGGATFLLLQNVHGRVQGPESINTPPVQTWRMIERVEEILREQGGTYAHVARTWFYLADILAWYDDFNRVRSEKYRSFGLMPRPGRGRILLPASTGISGENLHGAAALMDLLAVIPGEACDVTVEQLTNRRQKDAVRYGSAFSRGARIVSASSRRAVVQVSGTAAIDHRGESLYPGDVRSQIACTLDTIEALLEGEGAALTDIAAATVFVKRAEDAAVFHRMAVRRGLDPFPGVTVVADICRSELLFEIDAEVVCERPATP